MSGEQHWIPLESNPEVLNKYLQKLGLPKNLQWVDVFGFDDELLAMVPGKAVALIFLFPVTAKHDNFISKFETDSSSDIYFMKQTIGNACCTVALIHALANNSEKIDFGKGCFSKFYELSKNASPAEKAKIFEADTEMRIVHETCAHDGDTAPPPAAANVDYHFVVIVQKGKKLLFLDGRKDEPLKVKCEKEDAFLKEAAKLCQNLIALDPNDIRFTGLALTLTD